MQIAIPFSELSDLIRKETGQSIGLAYKSADEVSVNYTASIKVPLIGPVNKEIQAGLKLLEVSNEKVVFQLDAGMMNGVLDILSSFLLDKLPTGLVESFSNGIASLRLSAIPQLGPVLDRLEIDGISLDQDRLVLNARTK